MKCACLLSGLDCSCENVERTWNWWNVPDKEGHPRFVRPLSVLLNPGSSSLPNSFQSKLKGWVSSSQSRVCPVWWIPYNQSSWPSPVTSIKNWELSSFSSQEGYKMAKRFAKKAPDTLGQPMFKYNLRVRCKHSEIKTKYHDMERDMYKRHLVSPVFFGLRLKASNLESVRSDIEH